MTERKEKTMLKWLKQKPTHGHGGLPIEKITDDPLATIQVHPHAKKSKNKANEIYAVSRVNPLFEEEDQKEVFSPGGNSGSSGYDSCSGPSDDDFPIISNVAADLTDLQANILGRLTSSSALLTNQASAAAAAKHPQLFINTENDVIHHETAIVGPNGRPILQILEQNPNYVKSIALSVGNNGRKRPLSPISESSQQQQQNAQVLQRLNPSALSKYSPSGELNDAKTTLQNASTTPVDSVGSAKLLKKDTQYVRSIRIGGSNNPNFSNNSNAVTKRSILEANRRFSSSSSSSSNGPSRRPSVTFADDVAGGSRPGSRKPSMEQDSIVTESLLMMTSGGGSDARRFSNASNSSSTTNSRKTSVSSSQSKSQDEISTTETDEIASSGQETVDLEAFANSLRKSRPVKPFSNGTPKTGRSHGSSDDLDERSSSSSTPSEGYESTSPANERRGASPATSSPSLIHMSKNHKSPFGGIADHYAAAKEIAKEIESYSNGSAKASTKKSLVRDLLYRGNRNASNSNSISASNDNVIIGSSTNNSLISNPSYGTYNSKNGFRTSRGVGSSSSSSNGGGGRDGTVTKETRHHYLHSSSTLQKPEQQVILSTKTAASPPYAEPSSSSSVYGHGKSGTSNSRRPNSSQEVTTLRGGGNDDWELVRVQQVYVKADGFTSQDHSELLQTQRRIIGGGAGVGARDTLASASARKNDSSYDGRGIAIATHQGQDLHPATPSTSGSSSNPSRRHYHPSLATASTSSKSKTTTTLAATARGNASKKVPPTDDGLLPGARPRKHHDDTDSGNSTDRTYAEVRLEIEGTKLDIPGDKVSDSTIQVESDSSSPPENLPSKVMIVTGDSQNIVVDLSGVPHDLKNAIVSGTALITLPDGLDKLLQPGYTMITIPASKSVSTKSQLGGEDSSTTTIGARSSNLSKKDGATKITIGIDDEKPLVPLGGSSSNSSDDECKLYGSKNKTQIWDVLQNTMGKQHDAGGGGKGKNKKKITTVFPFHPNQGSSYESPDFTIEGHRLDRQRKKVELEKKRRCACRLCGMLFFLVAFLGVLVALSMIYTKGQRYFGSV